MLEGMGDSMIGFGDITTVSTIPCSADPTLISGSTACNAAIQYQQLTVTNAANTASDKADAMIGVGLLVVSAVTLVTAKGGAKLLSLPIAYFGMQHFHWGSW